MRSKPAAWPISSAKSFSSCFLTMDSNLGQVVSKNVNESPLAIGGVCASATYKCESCSKTEGNKKSREHKEAEVMEAILVLISVSFWLSKNLLI